VVRILARLLLSVHPGDPYRTHPSRGGHDE
jgi:hypothetical protein